METPPSTKTTISGDLPIRSAKPLKASQNATIITSPEPPNTVDAAPEKVTESAKKVMIHPQAQDLEADLATTVETNVSRKRHKNRRPKSKRGQGKPTGFEEYYAEGPITPKEYEEMRKLYDPARPFIDRVQDALARYQYKRRVEPDRRNIFHKYLQYGGVNAGQNQGQGLSDKDIKNMSREQAMQARSQTSIQQEREKLEINFNKVVQGFLGSFFVKYYNPENEEGIRLATVTIRNFFTFLLYHDVCPEYEENLVEARKTCDLATVELWKNLHLVRQAPGTFNRGCSMLFGGTYYETSGKTEKWRRLSDDDETTLTLKEAREVIKFGIASMGSEEQAKRFQQLVHADAVEAKEVHDIDGFEVLTITLPSKDVKTFYRLAEQDVTLVGKITTRSYRDPGKPDLDLSPEERKAWDSGNAPSYEFEFLVDLPLLEFFYPGLKVISPVWELNCGLHYFDDVISVYPSFYTVIANDLMLNWKTPRDWTENGTEASDKETLEATRHEGGEIKKQDGEKEQGVEEPNE